MSLDGVHGAHGPAACDGRLTPSNQRRELTGPPRVSFTSCYPSSNRRLLPCRQLRRKPLGRRMLLIAIGVCFVAAGVLCLVACIYDWEWFFGVGKQGSFSRLFGRRPARFFYGGFGVIVIIVGLIALVQAAWP